jgi:farnesyl-diphosphate farnesyltransferase
MRDRVRACSDALADFLARAVMSPEARLKELLSETSRTFALCIPLLGDRLRIQVTIAYLLFRIADTFEDASHWPVADRLAALDAFCALLCNPDDAEARRLAAAWHARRPSAHAGYMRLIGDVPLVIEAFTALPLPVRDVMKDHIIRSARGMAKFVAMTEGGELQLRDMQQLRDYCYAVAGIVGEMCTEIFLLDAPELCAAALFLRSRAAAFGEGLQLVNILKDCVSDRAEGRTYIPAGARPQDVFSLSRTDLELATEYTLALQSSGAPPGTIAFNALPIALARATLDRLESSNGATKITRAEVFRIMRHVNEAVAKGEPPLLRPSETPAAVGRMRSMFSLLFGMR